MLRTICSAVGIAMLGTLCLTLPPRQGNADQPKAQGIDAVQRAVATSAMPDDIKKEVATANAAVLGKVYFLWPMKNGTFLFGISTPKGGRAFTIKSGDLVAESMLKVLIWAYGSGTPLYVFAEPGKPQVAASIVTVRP